MWLMMASYFFISIIYSAIRSGDSREGMFEYFVEFLFYSMAVVVMVGFVMGW